MDTVFFEELIQKAESNSLDFKKEMYDFGGSDKKEKDQKRAHFVKDIICMANTPREEPSHIVLGVKKYINGSFELVGIESHVDDADMQEKLKGIVYPHPLFSYEPFTYHGKIFGIITIPADPNIGPFFPKTDLGEGLLRRNQLYHRRNSQNAEADQAEHKKIFMWFNKNSESPVIQEMGEANWDAFVSAVERFRPQRSYVLALSRVPSDKSLPLSNLGFVDWSFVADFDPESGISGVLSVCEETLESRRTLHRLTIGDFATTNVEKSTYWYFARGMSGRDSTLSTGTWLDWQKRYDKDLRAQLANIARISSSMPTTIVVLWDDNTLLKHLSSFLGAASSAFGYGAEVLLVCNNKSDYLDLAEDFEATIFEIPLHQFCHGLSSLQPRSDDKSAFKYTLPSSSGAPIEISKKDFLWLSEEMEVVHQHIGEQLTTETMPGRDFLRGKEITWYELGLHCDIEREITVKIKKSIREDLNKRHTSRINLYHAPGAGGTTVGRRILWDFRNDYPCFILHHTEPKQTAERLSRVVSLTGLPILLKLDGGEISERKSDELYEVLGARQLPVVIFQILRRFGSQRKMGERSSYLDGLLTDPEAKRFVHALTREAPNASVLLKKAIESNQPSERTPFFLGLITFGRDFISIEKYVQTRCEISSVTQRKILTFIAFAHYYGHKPTAAQAFTELLGILPSRQVSLEKYLTEESLELLIEIDTGHWRTAHHLIAEEILQQELGAIHGDRRSWKYQLSDWAIGFADFCRGRQPEPSDEQLELAHRVFVYRDNSDLLGTESAGGNHFSQLIMDIPLVDGRLRVLKKITELFPEEAHFWAHLGRLYSLEFKLFPEAVEAIERSLSINPDDNVLHHMKGMTLRAQAYFFMEQDEDVLKIVECAKQASESFAEARNLAPTDEYGYISETQMISRVMDYCGRKQNMQPIEAASKSTDPWLRECLQTAEDLLLQVRRGRLSETPSDREQRCRADLDSLYGNHEHALQIWDNLLTRRDSNGSLTVYAPPIRRQIIWTYLARKERNWDKLTQKEIERTVSLLEDNLKEDRNVEKDLRLWIQAIRRLNTSPTLESAIEKVTYWKLFNDSLDALYYLYVIHVLQAIEGSVLSSATAIREISECRTRSRFRLDRTKSWEWLGNGSGIKQLVHQERLGAWDVNCNFWANPSLLRRMSGVITQIDAPQAGFIEFNGGLTAFFVPAISGHYKGRSENQTVSFYLGFSYDGPRAWSVQDL